LKQVEISYDELEQDFINEFKKLGSKGIYQRGVLATSVHDNVTARRMRFIADGIKIYCYTDRGLRKVNQIIANPNVAVVVGFIQIEGVASLKGHPFDETEFLKLYEETQPVNYKVWRSGKRVTRERDMVLIEIAPKRIAMGRYADPKSGTEAGIYILNVEKRQAYRIEDEVSLHSEPTNAPAYNE